MRGTFGKSAVLLIGWMAVSALGSTEISRSESTPGLLSQTLIGHWNCEDNAGGARLVTDKVFVAGGQAVVDFHLDYSGAGRDDQMVLTMAGNWHLRDGILYEQGIAFKFSTLKVSGEDMLGSDLETALTAEMRQKAAVSRVVELTAHHLILSPIDAPNRLTCLRQD